MKTNIGFTNFIRCGTKSGPVNGMREVIKALGVGCSIADRLPRFWKLTYEECDAKDPMRVVKA